MILITYQKGARLMVSCNSRMLSLLNINSPVSIISVKINIPVLRRNSGNFLNIQINFFLSRSLYTMFQFAKKKIFD